MYSFTFKGSHRNLDTVIKHSTVDFWMRLNQYSDEPLHWTTNRIGKIWCEKFVNLYSTLVVLMEQPPFVPQGTKVGFTDETSVLGKHHPEENLAKSISK